MTYLSRFLDEVKDDNVVDIGDTIMNFGKYKGVAYKKIYEDKPYVKWIITKKDDKYVKHIKKYLLDRIKEEYGSEDE